MCGRYRLSRRKQIIEEHFDSISGEETWAPRYNVAPTQPVPIIRQNPKEPIRELSLVRAAEEALALRARELFHMAGDNIEEVEALDDAMYALHALQNTSQTNHPMPHGSQAS